MLPLRVELRTSRLLNGCSSQLSYRSGIHGPGEVGYRSPYLSHAKRALYHLSYIPRIHRHVRAAPQSKSRNWCSRAFFKLRSIARVSPSSELGVQGRNCSHGLGGSEISRAADAVLPVGSGVDRFPLGLHHGLLQHYALHLPRGRGGDVPGLCS